MGQGHGTKTIVCRDLNRVVTRSDRTGEREDTATCVNRNVGQTSIINEGKCKGLLLGCGNIIVSISDINISEEGGKIYRIGSTTIRY